MAVQPQNAHHGAGPANAPLVAQPLVATPQYTARAVQQGVVVSRQPQTSEGSVQQRNYGVAAQQLVAARMQTGVFTAPQPPWAGTAHGAFCPSLNRLNPTPGALSQLPTASTPHAAAMPLPIKAVPASMAQQVTGHVPQTGLQSLGKTLVNRRIEVHWPVDEAWYACVVLR